MHKICYNCKRFKKEEVKNEAKIPITKTNQSVNSKFKKRKERKFI